MKIAAIIAEFNPFHNGHAYLINETREKCKADCVVAFMSGDFVQRGIPAVCDKFTRAEIAVKCGVDAVFELPVVYSSSAAPDFAFGGVSLAAALGCTDILAFGSESGSLDDLRKASDLLLTESPEFKERLNSCLKNGLSYPAAAAQAAGITDPSVEELLKSPNNTLGIEYIKAIKKIGHDMECFTIPRRLSLHDSNKLINDEDSGSSYTSASFIRNTLLKQNDNEALKKCVPSVAAEILGSLLDKEFPVVSKDFDLPLSVILYNMTNDEIDALTANSASKAKLKKYRKNFLDPDALKALIADRSLTEAAAGRLLAHAMLGIKDSDIDRVSGARYLRLLAMKGTSSELLKKIKETSKVPLITKMADFDIEGCPMLQKDIYASDLYSKIRSTKYGLPYVSDIARSPVIVR